ncbi:DM13 domain-containing protein [Eilatimonas milleporae]|uniref:Electron transfer DM13 n=1 Tax=Eilatimonas milleporae TaxID=911205 RepID=A0A3M0CT61_9PROT|nr:DM13 domain-containing protein [Eilatimonas milleporae]RMB12197.1 electron transfer DM13 [Eilatimonas milleporae]
MRSLLSLIASATLILLTLQAAPPALIPSALIPSAMAQEPSAEAATLLHGGTWVKKSKHIRGQWKIVEEDGRKIIVLGDDFRTSSAPDLKIFLSPLDIADLKNRNAIDGARFISPLASARGAQRYEIPADVDLSAFKAIIIHCEAYTKLWGGSNLSD